jgi:hypothetical protein
MVAQARADLADPAAPQQVEGGLAEQLARNVPGVVAVANELAIEAVR